MMLSRTSRSTSARGHAARALTLIELLVVLVILTILATVAIRSTEGVFTQSRYDATVRTLRNIDLAIVGDRDLRQNDGTPLITGFLADIGRLPQPPQGELVSGQNLAELWDETLWNEFPYEVRSPIDHESIKVACGWRGPYLTPGIGSRSVLDGWGRPFVLLIPEPDDNEPFDLRIVSPGADGSLETEDLFDTTNPYEINLVQDYSQGSTVSVSVARRTSEGDLDYIENTSELNGDQLVVMLFVPDPAATNGIAIRQELFSGSDIVFENVPPGRRAFRAYISTSTTPTETTPADVEFVTRYVLIPLTGTTTVELVFPSANP